MPIENEDLQLFQIIYAQNPGQPISFIQEEVLKAKLALLQNAEKLQNAAEREKMLMVKNAEPKAIKN